MSVEFAVIAIVAVLSVSAVFFCTFILSVFSPLLYWLLVSSTVTHVLLGVASHLATFAVKLNRISPAVFSTIVSNLVLGLNSKAFPLSCLAMI